MLLDTQQRQRIVALVCGPPQLFPCSLVPRWPCGRNLSSHTRKAVVERFGEKAGGWLWDRFKVHYTPKHGSWLNQAEIAISLFSRQCLGQRRIGDRASRKLEPGVVVTRLIPGRWCASCPRYWCLPS